MRVVAGNYKGRKLKALSGDNTRPTTDKVKESIFNRIGPYFDGEQVLDLFAGSGGLAIEAISRGAGKAVCVDRNFGAIRVIKENIAITKEPEKFVIKKMNADKALLELNEEQAQFNLVFLDPPYAEQRIIQQMEKMVELDLLKSSALVICETDVSVMLPEEHPAFGLWRRQKYGRSEIVIYRKR